jgi:hypothetical protein
MSDDPKSLAAEIDQLAAGVSRLADRVRQLENVDGSVVTRILQGELLQLDQAADIAECSDEKIRKQCELTAGTKRPLGVKFAGRWMVSVNWSCATILSKARSTGAVVRMCASTPRSGRENMKAGRGRWSRW